MQTARAPTPIATLLGIAAVFVILLALYLGRSLFAPVFFSVFIIALVWPLQSAMEKKLPRVLAMFLAVVVTGAVMVVMASLVLWSLNRAVQWAFANASAFQAQYLRMDAWLQAHGLYLASEFVHNFDPRWLFAALQRLGAGLQYVASFVVIALVFVILGLLEVDSTRRKLVRAGKVELVSACRAVAGKFQRYMAIRAVMSLATGLGVWALTYALGVDLALEWGVTAFALNFIPFLGPLFATMLPTLFAIVQFDSLLVPLSIFVGLNVVQFLIGSYLEPRVAGDQLSISPFLVLFAVFMWSMLWGIAGAFIGVPILIAAMTLAEYHPTARRWALLLAGDPSRHARANE
ncbi:AI-2E family transporter [Lysobacter auxotrophicus]|uniref:AI-2E family transporter n=1 Tax=Lysobacter auxotrophicus TaxID=2992573 RepID=A0ABN6UKB3_9GAMM|nr:AI-2E family transporter [Lysobacter auxotrophicus]BDU16729.1 AI-2E family transporter [Lysobacter auxotrophicus]